MPIDKQGANVTVDTVGHLFDDLYKSIHELNSCKLADSGDPCEVDGGGLCKADDGELVTAHLQMPQLPPCFRDASHATRTFVCLAASLLKLKSSKLPISYFMMSSRLT